MIDDLDTVAAATVDTCKVFTLKKADAILTANLIRQLFTGQTTTGGAGGAGGLGGGGALGGGAARRRHDSEARSSPAGSATSPREPP